MQYMYSIYVRCVIRCVRCVKCMFIKKGSNRKRKIDNTLKTNSGYISNLSANH